MVLNGFACVPSPVVSDPPLSDVYSSSINSWKTFKVFNELQLKGRRQTDLRKQMKKTARLWYAT